MTLRNYRYGSSEEFVLSRSVFSTLHIFPGSLGLHNLFSIIAIQNPYRGSANTKRHGIHRWCCFGRCTKGSRRVLAVQTRVSGAGTECAEKT